jgi:ubiquinone/menaquinone biosynthesis C-methylase UbiE
MIDHPYFLENENETNRLLLKTNAQAVIDQARWAGLQEGMRVLDVGCGPGLTTSILAQAAQPGGSAVGLDRSADRIAYARGNYAAANVTFEQRNFFDDLSDLGEFDFVWMRFILEYFLEEAYQLATNVARVVKPGGILCLIDLDRNCMNHYGHSTRLERAIQKVAECQMSNNNFDPYAGAKIYSHLSQLGFSDIQMDLRAHHLFYGELPEKDRSNFWLKLECGVKNSGWTFDDYADGFAGFEKEFKEYFADKGRFAYTPMILGRGVKPGGFSVVPRSGGRSS